MSFLGRLFSRQVEPSATDDRAGASLERLRSTTELAHAGAPAAHAAELRIEAGLASDPGCVREINEDSIRIIRPTTDEELSRRGMLAVVCDGMGGHEGGEIASRLAVEAIVKRFEGDEGEPPPLLPKALQLANRAIFESAERNLKLRGMGTTCTALLLRGGLAYAAHVGDSRLYLIRGDEIFLMTEDHSAVMELVRRGVISRDEARHHPDKNVISRALGSHREVDVASWPQPFAVLPGDAFLLCSDGLHDLVTDETILATVRGTHPQVACDRLITLAREAGGHDNISVAILTMVAQHQATSTGARETRAVEIPQ
jgi:protein phosphatase